MPPQLLSRNSPLTPLVWSPEEAEAASLQPPQPALAPVFPATAAAMPSLGSIAATPSVTTPLLQRKAAVEADLARLATPAHPTTALGKIGHTAANIGNVLGTIFAPGITAGIKGSNLNKAIQHDRDLGELDEISQLQSAETAREAQSATADYTRQRPAIEQSKIDQKQRTAQNAVSQRLAARGQVPTFDADGNLTDVEDNPELQAYHTAAATALLHQANAEKAEITSSIAKNKFVPGTPEYEDAQRRLAQIDRRISVAQQNVGVRGAELGIHRERLTFDEDKQYNPEPTATERKTGDLAQSAVNQVNTMESVIAKRPDLFGPGAGRANRLQQWLGSQDPDAATYQAAQTYLAEHSAGVFGGRGKYILEGLHSLTNEHTNPEALSAILADAKSTAQHFVNAGTTHARGEQGFAAKQGTKASGGASPTATPRPAGVPSNYVLRDGPKGRGWYKP